MTITLTDHRSILNEADATTSWTGAPVLFTSDPDPAEAGGCIGYVVSTATVDAYVAVTSFSFTGKVLYVWVRLAGAMDTLANGGAMVHVGDNTNRVGYHFAGSDTAVFRHQTSIPDWQCMMLDQANRPSFTTRAGAEGSMAWGSITQVGAVFKTLAKSKGNVANCFVDIIRVGNPSANDGCFVTITGGTSGAPGSFSEIAATDRSSATQAAHGAVREFGTGAYGIQVPIRFGNASGSASSWFEETNATLIFSDALADQGRFRIIIRDNGTGTTTFKLGTKVGSGTGATGKDGCALYMKSTGVWDSGTDTNVTDVFCYATLFSEFGSGTTRKVILGINQEFIDCTFSACGQITVGGGAGGGSAYLVNSSVVNSSAGTGAGSVLWNTNTDPDTRLHGMKFTMGASSHAIEFGSNTPSTIYLRNITFTDYNASDEQTDSAIYNNSGKAITINVVGGTTPSVRNGSGASTTLVVNPVSVAVNVKNTAGTNIQNARVLLLATSGGPFPVDATVTITRSGSTATVSHTTHGMATNDYVMISGADQYEYNGVFQITYINANSYSYTVSGTPTTPATGTIKATFAALYGLTDASGNLSTSRVYTSSQPVSGRVRKSSAQPYYKTADFTGSVNNSTGFSANIQMISDE